MSKKEKAASEGRSNKPQVHSNSKKAQRNRILSELRLVGSEGLSTIEARERLDCMMPAARVHELRWREGHNIQLIWDRDRNAQGNEHSCGRYFLLPGKWQGIAA